MLTIFLSSGLRCLYTAFFSDALNPMWQMSQVLIPMHAWTFPFVATCLLGTSYCPEKGHKGIPNHLKIECRLQMQAIIYF